MREKAENSSLLPCRLFPYFGGIADMKNGSRFRGLGECFPCSTLQKGSAKEGCKIMEEVKEIHTSLADVLYTLRLMSARMGIGYGQ